jgi:hypothetical protein
MLNFSLISKQLGSKLTVKATLNTYSIRDLINRRPCEIACRSTGQGRAGSEYPGDEDKYAQKEATI